MGYLRLRSGRVGGVGAVSWESFPYLRFSFLEPQEISHTLWAAMLTSESPRPDRPRTKSPLIEPGLCVAEFLEESELGAVGGFKSRIEGVPWCDGGRGDEFSAGCNEAVGSI